jgi:YYY domain-containing protein
VFGLLVLTLALAPADPLSLFPERIAASVRQWAGVVPADLRGRGPVSLRAEAVRPSAAIVAGLFTGLIGGVLAAPFLLSATGGGDRGIELLAASARSGLGGLALVHGAFVTAFAVHLWTRLRPDRPWLVVAALVVLGWVALSIQAPVLALIVPLGVAVVIGLRLSRPLGFESVLILAGAGLVTIVELLYVAEQAGPGRLNTVFKVYMQTWVLWGVAAGVAVPGLLSVGERIAAAWPVDAAAHRPGVRDDAGEDRPHREVPTAESTAGSGEPWPDVSGLRGTASALLVIGLVLSTSVYGGLALSAHFDHGGQATLDATAFVEREHPEDAPAIDYVDSLDGQPTLLSAPATSRCLDLDAEYPCPPGMYDWDSSPAASLTGVPTVAGWAHEIGYRGEDAYVDRARDVDAIYTGDPETRARLLAAYDVEYIWVGAAERDRYGSVSFAESPGVEPVFEEGRVTIYRVDHDRLASAE